MQTPQMKPLQAKAVTIKVLTLLLVIFAAQALGHVRWDPSGQVPPRNSDGAYCGTRGGSPTLLQSGASITVTYQVLVTHGNSLTIDFSEANDEGFEDHLIAPGLAEIAGNGFVSIVLPNIQCDACTLRIHGSGYESCADVQLTATGLPDPDPSDTTPPASVSSLSANVLGDKQISLEWTNPTEDFFRALVLRSESATIDAPTSGETYAAGDSLGSASVIHAGAGGSVVATGLTQSTTYYFSVVSFDASLNYAAGETVNATTENVGNTAPTVTLNVLQGSELGRVVDKAKGQVIVQSVVSDADVDDQHVWDWTETDSRLDDTDSSESTLTFDPSQLEKGSYVVKVNVTDNGTPPFAVTDEVTISVIEPDPPEPEPTPQGSSGGGATGLLLLLLLPILVLARSRKRFFTS